MSVAAAYLGSTGGPAFGRQPVPGFENVRSDLAAQLFGQVALNNAAYNQKMAQTAVDGTAAGGSALAQAKMIADARLKEAAMVIKGKEKPTAYDKWAALLRSSGGVGGVGGGGSSRRAAGLESLARLGISGDVSAPGAITNAVVGQNLDLRNAVTRQLGGSQAAAKGAIDLVAGSMPNYSNLTPTSQAPAFQPVSTAAPAEATPALRAPVAPTDAEIAERALQVWGPRPKT